MTYVGKILVFVIMVFAVIFLGISTVVFSTNTNWKEATTKERQKVQELTKSVSGANDRVAAAQKDLEAAKKAHEAEVKKLNDQIVVLQGQITNAQAQATAARNDLGITQKNMQVALDEANSRKAETDQLRVQKAAVEKQASDFKIRQTELMDKIRELQRMLDTAKSNATDLRDRVARYSSLLRSKGLSDDISQVKGQESPPPVEGEVLKVTQNRLVELSIGSDDGLVPGHILYLYRTKPRAEYLCKVKITAVDPDQAVGEVVGKTVQGKKIQEGDSVSSSIRPRS
jgi:hypothetical protein